MRLPLEVDDVAQNWRKTRDCSLTVRAPVKQANDAKNVTTRREVMRYSSSPPFLLPQ